MKQLLEDIENMTINQQEEAPAQLVKDEKQGNGLDDNNNANMGVAGILNDNAGGGLGTIKDEDSNADSDFSGDDGGL